MLTILWTWTLFESWLLIIWRLSVSEKSHEVKACSVSSFNSDGNMLLFGMREHSLVKNFKTYSNAHSTLTTELAFKFFISNFLIQKENMSLKIYVILSDKKYVKVPEHRSHTRWNKL